MSEIIKLLLPEKGKKIFTDTKRLIITWMVNHFKNFPFSDSTRDNKSPQVDCRIEMLMRAIVKLKIVKKKKAFQLYVCVLNDVQHSMIFFRLIVVISDEFLVPYNDILSWLRGPLWWFRDFNVISRSYYQCKIKL